MRKMFMALGVAAALLTLGSTAAQAAVQHNRPAATPACGDNCFALSSLVLGPDVIQNAYIKGDLGTGGRVGQNVNLKTASNSHPNEDFSGANVGDLADFCGGTIPAASYVCVNYPSTYPGLRVELGTVRQRQRSVRGPGHRQPQRRGSHPAELRRHGQDPVGRRPEEQHHPLRAPVHAVGERL